MCVYVCVHACVRARMHVCQLVSTSIVNKYYDCLRPLDLRHLFCPTSDTDTMRRHLSRTFEASPQTVHPLSA